MKKAAASESRIALLRGINVGKAKRVSMEDLRGVLEGLGYANARTVLNSGNVVFSGPRETTAQSARRIESALADRLGLAAQVFVLSAAEWAEVAAENPLRGSAYEPSRVLVSFVRSRADLGKLKGLTQQAWGKEALTVGSRAAYLWCADGVYRSPVAAGVERALQGNTTMRNWSTVLRLHSLAGR